MGTEHKNRNDNNYSRKNAMETIYKLKKYPEIGNIPLELERINIYNYREIHSVPYRIIYQLLDDCIYIHSILDGRRDIRSLLIEKLLKP